MGNAFEGLIRPLSGTRPMGTLSPGALQSFPKPQGALGEPLGSPWGKVPMGRVSIWLLTIFH